jgi:hypothetical protein
MAFIIHLTENLALHFGAVDNRALQVASSKPCKELRQMDLCSPYDTETA